MVSYRFQAVSRPRLSYTPPSLRTSFVVNGCRLRSSPSPLGSNFIPYCETSISQGERMGGNADEAATARARGSFGLNTWPTRKSRRYGETLEIPTLIFFGRRSGGGGSLAIATFTRSNSPLSDK